MNYQEQNKPQSTTTIWRDYANLFTQQYGQIENWPTPYCYGYWFLTLDITLQPYNLEPQFYTQLYELMIRSDELVVLQGKQSKLSRHQKRKLKKKELQEQLEKQKKAIGAWVKLQRKDLISELQIIKIKEQRMKKKKEDKLGHLIEIHKEIYKMHLKKGASVQIGKNRKIVRMQLSKKKLSQIKKMRAKFMETLKNRQIKIEQSAKQKTEQENQIIQETDLLSMSDSQIQQNDEQQWKQAKKDLNYEQHNDKQDKFDQNDDKQQQLVNKNDTTPNKNSEQTLIEQTDQSKQQQQIIKVAIEHITYDFIGKLTGKLYHNYCLRQWVTNTPSEELQDIVLRLVNRLAYKQAVKRVQKPQKARKLIVSGVKQVRRTMTTIDDKKKSKVLIVALNIERNNLKRGIDDEIIQMIKLAQGKLKIPIIHVSTRKNLGRAFTGKFGPKVTLVSIVNPEGYIQDMHRMLEQWRIECQKYNQLQL